MRYLAADYETGGLYPRYHAPVSLAVILMDDGEVLDRFYEMFPMFDDLAYTPKALEVNGEAWEAIRGREKTELAIMQTLKDWAISHDARHLPIIAHNAEFDQGFYLSSSVRTKMDPLLGGWVCTKRLAKDKPLGQVKFTLDATAERFGLARTSEIHNGLEDAILAGLVFAKLRQVEVAAA